MPLKVWSKQERGRAVAFVAFYVAWFSTTTLRGNGGADSLGIPKIFTEILGSNIVPSSSCLISRSLHKGICLLTTLCTFWVALNYGRLPPMLPTCSCLPLVTSVGASATWQIPKTWHNSPHRRIKPSHLVNQDDNGKSTIFRSMTW